MIDTTKPLVILVTYYFPPGGEIGGQRPFRFYKYLQRMGYECQVITASQPADEVSPFVTWVPDSLANVWDGTSTSKLSREGKIELLARRFFFPGHLGLAWSLKVARRCRSILEAHRGRNAVVFTTYPPLGVLLAGLLIRWRSGIPWVCDFRDPMAFDTKVVRVSRWHVYCNRKLERLALRAADFIIANTQSAAETLMEHYPWTGSKLRVIWNGFDPEERPQARPLPARRKRTTVHTGSLSFGRNPNRILESMSRLWQSGSEEARQTKMVLVGCIEMEKAGLNREVCEQGQSEGWLELIPPVARPEAHRISEEADGLLLVQPHTKIQVPGKLFEYLCIGRPILALVPRQSAVEYVLGQAGVPYICVYVDDEPDTVDRKMLEFLSLPQTPTRYSEWFETNFNAEQQTHQLAEIIEALAKGKGSLPSEALLDTERSRPAEESSRLGLDQSMPGCLVRTQTGQNRFADGLLIDE